MMDESSTHKYEMTITLDALEHLGVGLYSNVPAVLSEVVANSYDADASRVDIEIDSSKGEIAILDDGHGMSSEELNSRYLTVGYLRRKHEPIVTPKYGRKVMGRKGIGKLSVFSIANTVEVQSVKDGDRSGFIMDVDDMEKQLTGGNKYYPEPLEPGLIVIETGTKIVLRNLKKNISALETSMRRRLARRFSIIGLQYHFEVFVDGESISAKDRDFFPKIEFLWYFGKKSEEYLKECPNLQSSKLLDDVVDRTKRYKVEGWLGTVKTQDDIDEQNNAIVVFARGKLIQEDVLKDLKEGGVFSKYLIGEIDAEFMDDEEQADLVTSDRQHVKEDDPRYEAVKKFLSDSLDTVNTDWGKFRSKIAEKKALENPAIKEWFLKIGKDQKEIAKKLFTRIESLKGLDDESKRELYRSSILAFERLRLTDSLSTFELIQDENDFAIIKGFFDGIDEIERVQYHTIVKGRLAVIQKLVKLADSQPSVKERVLQEHIFDHLWLLHPSWDRASTNQRIEQSVTKEFNAVTAKLTKEEKEGRIDIRYKTAAGKHIIVELKKYDRKVTVDELIPQIRKYRNALEKCLKSHLPDEKPIIESIIILGDHPEPKSQPETNIQHLSLEGARYVLYDQLITDALQGYQEYIEKDKAVSELLNIVDKI
ncbi:MAG: hypothetical protein C3F13_08350 [Anaerolineales bacterium]|nr:MAG: hypothetical protein C3F13_08350 [Anaerolineales bacterium]